MNKQIYCLGFLIDPVNQQVVLIQKDKPEFQKGKYNGVGGKLEPTDESIHDAMVREFKEETGFLIREWNEFEVIGDTDWTVHCFVAANPQSITYPIPRVKEGEEQAEWYSFEEVDSMSCIQMLVENTYALYIKARATLTKIL